jgi:ribokinase
VPERILVAGAINTDLVATIERAPSAGETLNGTSFSIHGGGKAANQAVAAARSGGQVTLLGAVGNDDFGRARIADLERDGIAVDWVQVDASLASGVALILVEPGGENRIVCVPGATERVDLDQAIKAFDAVKPSWLLATNELRPEVLDGLFLAARDVGTRIVYNTAPEPSTVASMLGLVDIMIANQVEVMSMLGSTDLPDPATAVRAVFDTGVPCVVLTLGSAGAIIADPDGVESVEPPAVAAVDTTGAGDTFAGSLVASLAAGLSTREALRYAVHASALSVTKQGAQSSIPTRSAVESKWPHLVRTT